MERRSTPDRRPRGSGRFGRYTVGARVYDLVSLERPIYRAGRQAAIDLLQLQPGEQVLDVGCGTGLNFALLDAAVGPTGTIIGVDLSAHMLARAHARVARRGWGNACLVQADAGTADLTAMIGREHVDAVVFTYALSVIADGSGAWRAALAALRPGGRVAVADLDLPRGRWRLLAPLARLACRTGGIDRHRRTWQWVERDTEHVQRRVLRAGHIQVAAGTRAPTERETS